MSSAKKNMDGPVRWYLIVSSSSVSPKLSIAARFKVVLMLCFSVVTNFDIIKGTNS